MPIGLGAILGAGSSLAGGILSSSAATQAAQIQAQAAAHAADLQFQEFGQIQQNLQPYMQTGQAGLNALQGLYGLNSGGQFDPNAPFLQPITNQIGPPPTLAQVPGFNNAPEYNLPAYNWQQSPGYAAALQGGTDALQNAGATRGGALSGNTLKALSQYGTGAANQDYQQGYANNAAAYGNQFQDRKSTRLNSSHVD